MKLLAVILSAILLASCCHPMVVDRPLPLPDAPQLPVIQEAQLQCLSQEAYKSLVERDLQRKLYADKLISIIRSTHTGGE